MKIIYIRLASLGQQCPSGFAAASHWCYAYQASSANMAWANAKSHCENLGVKLVDVETQQEWNATLYI